jgi:hypothetical protein
MISIVHTVIDFVACEKNVNNLTIWLNAVGIGGSTESRPTSKWSVAQSP